MYFFRELTVLVSAKVTVYGIFSKCMLCCIRTIVVVHVLLLLVIIMIYNVPYIKLL